LPVYFHVKQSQLGYMDYGFWSFLEWKLLVYFMAIWHIYFKPFDTFYGYLVYFVVVWYFFRCGMYIVPNKCGNAIVYMYTTRLSFVINYLTTLICNKLSDRCESDRASTEWLDNLEFCL
jgi:hypothetical protein